MKLIKTASGKQTVKMSKREWQSIGKKAGWMKIAWFEDAPGAGKFYDAPGAGDIGGYPGIPYAEYDDEEPEEEQEDEIDVDALRDEFAENDIQATLAEMQKGIPLERIDTILAKDIIKARKENHQFINDYNFNKGEDLREWASWIDYRTHAKIAHNIAHNIKHMRISKIY